MKKTVAIALSGGVDSLAAAHLLKQQGNDLFGIHFTTGYETEGTPLEKIESQLDIPIKCIELGEIFEKKVVNYFIDAYLTGLTPNPCMICNRSIKFGALHDAATGSGATAIATGHYVRYENNRLLKGTDRKKEQSYFLAMVGHDRLANTLFPLGNMTKKEVVQVAQANRLVPLEKKESQDICFIKKRSVSDFIAFKTGASFTPGKIVTPKGQIIGSHNGLHGFTIGQRRGINCPGPEPYYVKAIDLKRNRLIVGLKSDLLQRTLVVKDINWLIPPPSARIQVETKIRYSHTPAGSLLIPESNHVKIIFNTPQNAVTPGQCAVFYRNDQVLGAGIIQQETFETDA